MQLRLPWILSRRRLVAAVLLESILFVTLYNIFYLHSFGRWPNGSILLVVLWAAWVLSSYVLGRYEGVNCIQGPTGVSIVQSVVQTALVLSISLSGMLTYLWLFKSNGGNLVFRSILIPYLSLLGLVSLLLQTLLSTWVRTRPAENKQWKFLGNIKTYQRLSHHLKWSRMPAGLEYWSYSMLNETELKLLVVENISSLPVNIIKHLLELQQQGCKIISRQEWCESILQRFPSEFLNDEDLLRGKFTLPQGTFQTRLKRLGDVLLSTLLLVITSPIVMISAVMIKIEDRGPIFYSQIRSGLDGKPYIVFKLRSMRLDAERDGAQWVSSTDKRITKIGSVLRKTRIDELPQLWCVFVGNMSLIGPRPERPEFDQELEQKIPHYRLRQRMRPGLSGWAQVNYPYGASVDDAANKLSYDLYYMRNFSFWLDLLILFKTIKLVIRAQGSVPHE